MSTIRGLRLLNTIEAGTTSGAQLQTLLGDAGRASEFSSVVGTKGNAKRLAVNDTSMIAITNSAIALTTVTSNPNTMGEIAQSTTAMYRFISNAAARESFFQSKYHVGKGLDTLILDVDNTTNSTLASQQRITNVFNDQTSTQAVYSSNVAINQIANSTVARSNALTITNSITQFENYPLALAKVIEGQLGGNIVAASNFDTVLNTSGRLTSILADSSLANAVKSAGVVTAGKTLAKLAGYNPTQIDYYYPIISNSTIWTTVCGNTTTQGFTVESSALRNSLTYYNNNFFEQLVQLHKNAAWDTRWKSYWEWNSAYYLAGSSYYPFYAFGSAIFTSSTGEKYFIWNGATYNDNYRRLGVVWSTNSSNRNGGYLSPNTGSSSYYGTSSAANSTHALIGTNNGYIYYADESPVGELNNSWNAVQPQSNSNPIYGIAYGNGVWVFVGQGRSCYASNPSSWTQITDTLTNLSMGAVTFAFNKFIAFDTSRNVYTSTNGSTWSNVGSYPVDMTGSCAFGQWAYNGTTLFFVSQNDSEHMIKSTNGTTWTLAYLPGNAAYIYGISWSGSEFYATTGDGLYKSTDGTTWTYVATGAYWNNARYISATDRFVLGATDTRLVRNF